MFGSCSPQPEFNLQKDLDLFFAQEPLVVELRSGNTHHVPIASCLPYGCFHKWGYPNSWMVYNGKSQFEMIYMK